MRWKGNRRSDNIEDQRHVKRSSLGGMGGGGGLLKLLPMVFRFLGFKGTAILVVAIGAYGVMTGNLGTILGLLTGQQQTNVTQQTIKPITQSAQEKELVEFYSYPLFSP